MSNFRRKNRPRIQFFEENFGFYGAIFNFYHATNKKGKASRIWLAGRDRDMLEKFKYSR